MSEATADAAYDAHVAAAPASTTGDLPPGHEAGMRIVGGYVEFMGWVGRVLAVVLVFALVASACALVGVALLHGIAAAQAHIAAGLAELTLRVGAIALSIALVLVLAAPATMYAIGRLFGISYDCCD